jgi:hypothetical protein
MKSSPLKPPARVSIISAFSYASPNSNSSIVNGAWSSAASARFPVVKSFDTFDFAPIPSLNKRLVLELARCEYVVAREKNLEVSFELSTVSACETDLAG